MYSALRVREVVHNLIRRSEHNVIYRGLSSCAITRVARPFKMPAVSPTMTEGNNGSGKVEEEQKVSVGDVLLKIETDKAQMDVETQDNGLTAKMIQVAGFKGIKAGARIARATDADDDSKTLETPTESDKGVVSAQEELGRGISIGKCGELQARAPLSLQGESAGRFEVSESRRSPHRNGGKPSTLLPSVTQLLHEREVDPAVVKKIPTSGPHGRLLKGDVLAYLGAISPTYPAEQSRRLAKLENLDLSSVQTARVSEPQHEADQTKATGAETVQPKQLAVSISLDAVQDVQSRLKVALGINVPTETFISRAIHLSNHRLPSISNGRTSGDTLFCDIVGIDSDAPKSKRPPLVPEVAVVSHASAHGLAPAGQVDVLDELCESAHKALQQRQTHPPIATGSRGVFRVAVPSADSQRAEIFLSRLQTVLQNPGRLVV